MRPLRLVVVDRSEETMTGLLSHLQSWFSPVRWERVEHPKELENVLSRQVVDLVLFAPSSGHLSLEQALTLTRGRAPLLILDSDRDTALAAWRAGAAGYVDPNDYQFLQPLIERLIREAVDQAASQAAQRAIAQNEAILRMAFDRVSAALLVCDAQGEIGMVNRGAEKLFGYASHEFIGRPIASFVPSLLADPSINGRRLQALHANGKAFTIWAEMRGWRTPKGRHWVATLREGVEGSLVPSRQQGRERFSRLAIRRTREVENLLALLLVQPECRQEIHHGKTARADLELLSHQLDRTNLLLSRLLDKGPATVRREVDLSAVLVEVCRHIRPLLGERMMLEQSTVPEPVLAYADPILVEQALVNVCLNARDAMPTGGRLRLEVAHVSLDDDFCHHRPWAQAGEWARIRVSDTGIGMDDATRTRLLEPFASAKETGTRTGLGLPVVTSLVFRQDGLLDIQSRLGKGTTIDLYFPHTGGAARASIRSTPSTKKSTVLVADDDELVLRNAARILRGLGYEVLLASSGEEAVSMFEAAAGRIALVVLDLVMPGMDGRGAYENIRAKTSGTKFLFVSAHAENYVEQLPFNESGLRFLPKPYRTGELEQAVRELLATS